MKTGNGEIYVRDNRLFIDREHIENPSIYRNICPSKALLVSGEEKTVDEMLVEVEKDIPSVALASGVWAVRARRSLGLRPTFVLRRRHSDFGDV